jgi:hypothetical protein
MRAGLMPPLGTDASGISPMPPAKTLEGDHSKKAKSSPIGRNHFGVTSDTTHNL